MADRSSLQTQYEVLTSWLVAQDTRRWNLLGSFLLLNGLLSAALFSARVTDGAQRVICAAGLLLSLAWLVILWRNALYSHALQRLVVPLEGTLLGRSSQFRFFRDDGSNATGLGKGVAGWARRNVKAHHVFYLIVFASAALWLVSLFSVPLGR